MDTEKTAVEIEWIEVIMQIFVDADACPVVGIVESLAEKYNIPTTLLCDTNHVLYSDYSDVIIVGAGTDAVDYKLISICHKGDIVVSQDYGGSCYGTWERCVCHSPIRQVVY